MQMNLDNENGRSLVEVLGVLAIMGILSLTGIHTYKMAMEKHEANEILYEIRQRAVSVSAQRMLGRDVDISDFPDKIRNSAVLAKKYKTSRFAIIISSLSHSNCVRIKSILDSTPTIRMLHFDDNHFGAVVTECSLQESAGYAFLFNNDLNQNFILNECSIEGEYKCDDLNGDSVYFKSVCDGREWIIKEYCTMGCDGNNCATS